MLNLPIPNMLNGVSQQPPQVRFPNQCEELLNGIPSPSESLIKRYPTDHVVDWSLNDLDLGADPKAMLHVWDRGDGAEAYALVVHSGGIKAWDLYRNREVPVTGPFTYLNSVQDPVKDVSLVTIGDYTLVSNRNETVAMKPNTTTRVRPQGFFWVNAANYLAQYDVILRFFKADGSEYTSTVNGQEVSVIRSARITAAGPEAATVTSSELLDGENWVNQSSLNGMYLAARLKTALAASLADPGLPGGNLSNWVKLTRSTYGVAVDLDVNVTDNPIHKILVTVSDSIHGNGIKSLDSATGSGSVLPQICRNNLAIRVVGDSDGTEDDYWLKFVGTAPGDSISEGYWIESTDPTSEQSLDEDTMPHALIRQFYIGDDDPPDGSQIGDPYFTFVPLDGSDGSLGIGWGDRAAGDENTNPDPPFVGTTIQSMFMFQGRLGFLSGEAVCLSQSGKFFDFFRSTVLNLLDTAPISVLSAYPQVTEFTNAIPLESNLVLFSPKVQMILTSPDTEVLTPRTAILQPVAQHDCEPFCRPASVDQEIFFPFNRSGPFVGIRDMIVSSTNLQAVVAPEITAHVPRYIPGHARVLQVSPYERVLAVLTEQDASSLYVYNWFNSDEGRVQSAWSRWVFSGFEIIGLGWFGSKLIILSRDPFSGQIGIRDMDIRHGRTDPQSAICVRLDNRQVVQPDDTNQVTIAEQFPYIPPVSFSLNYGSTVFDSPNAVAEQTVTVVPDFPFRDDPWSVIKTSPSGEDPSWVGIINGTGNGAGSFSFVLGSNADSPTPRMATVQLSGHPGTAFNIFQAGNIDLCGVTINPSDKNVPKTLGFHTLTVETVCSTSLSWEFVYGDWDGGADFSLSAVGPFATGTHQVTATVKTNSGPARAVRVTASNANGSSSCLITQASGVAYSEEIRHLLPYATAGDLTCNPLALSSESVVGYSVLGTSTASLPAFNPVIDPPVTVNPGSSKSFKTAMFRPPSGATSGSGTTIDLGYQKPSFSIHGPFSGQSYDYGVNQYSFPTYPNTVLIFDVIYRRSFEWTGTWDPNAVPFLWAADSDFLTFTIAGATDTWPIREGSGLGGSVEEFWGSGNVLYGGGAFGNLITPGNSYDTFLIEGTLGDILWTAPAKVNEPRQFTLNGVSGKISFAASWAPIVAFTGAYSSSQGMPGGVAVPPNNWARGIRGHIAIEITSSTDPEANRIEAVGFINTFDPTKLGQFTSFAGPFPTKFLTAKRKTAGSSGANASIINDSVERQSPRSAFAIRNLGTSPVILEEPPGSNLARSLRSDIPQYKDRFVYASGPRAGETVREISRTFDPQTGNTVITLDSDGSPLFYGNDYTFLYRFSQPYLRPGEGSAAMTTGRFQVRAINLNYEDSGPFRAEVVPKNREVYSKYIYDRGSTVNSSYVDQALDTGTMRIPVMSASEQVDVDVINDTPYPSKIVSASIEASYDSRSRRI